MFMRRGLKKISLVSTTPLVPVHMQCRTQWGQEEKNHPQTLFQDYSTKKLFSETAAGLNYAFLLWLSSFNDDIYGIEIIYLEERQHVLVNILAMGSLVRWCCHQLTIIILVEGYYRAKRPLALFVCCYIQ
jgi:hypothetical protein